MQRRFAELMQDFQYKPLQYRKTAYNNLINYYYCLQVIFHIWIQNIFSLPDLYIHYLTFFYHFQSENKIAMNNRLGTNKCPLIFFNKFVVVVFSRINLQYAKSYLRRICFVMFSLSLNGICDSIYDLWTTLERKTYLVYFLTLL